MIIDCNIINSIIIEAGRYWESGQAMSSWDVIKNKMNFEAVTVTNLKAAKSITLLLDVFCGHKNEGMIRFLLWRQHRPRLDLPLRETPTGTVVIRT